MIAWWIKRGRQNPGFKSNERNPAWKGDSVGIEAVHDWVKRRKLKPKFCEDCGVKQPYDLANISQEYKRDLSDWKYICRSCHMKEDGRIIQLHTFCHRPEIYHKISKAMVGHSSTGHTLKTRALMSLIRKNWWTKQKVV